MLWNSGRGRGGGGGHTIGREGLEPAVPALHRLVVQVDVVAVVFGVVVQVGHQKGKVLFQVALHALVTRQDRLHGFHVVHLPTATIISQSSAEIIRNEIIQY